MQIRKNRIDFENLEKLVLAETRRKQNLFKRKSNKLLIALIVFLLIFIFLKK
jgi:hypothetical protein